MSKSKKQSPKRSGAVAQVWAIANKMPKAARKDVVAACVKAGINESTAKTQYQQWKHASPAQRKAKLEPKPSDKEAPQPRVMKKAA